MTDNDSILFGIYKEVGKIDGIAATVNDIKTDIKEQRSDIGELREATQNHEHRIKQLEAREDQFDEAEVEGIKRLLGRHKAITAVLSAGAIGAVTLSILDNAAVAHFLNHLGG